MSIEIPADFSPAVQRLIADGRFRDESDIIAEGLRLVIMHEKLREEVQEGLDDLAAGNRIDADTVYKEARTRIKEIEKRQAQ